MSTRQIEGSHHQAQLFHDAMASFHHSRVPPGLARAAHWIVHVLNAEHVDLAMRFTTRGGDKFSDAEFTPAECGLPVLARTCVTLDAARTPSTRAATIRFCSAGSNTRIGEALPAAYFRGTWAEDPVLI